MSRSTVVGVLTGMLLLLATTASAHPAFNPNAGPSGEPIASTLVVPHGCAPGGEMPDGDADADTVSPTVLLSLQVRDGVTIEPGEVDGWDTAVTAAEVTWTDAGGATTDVIQLPVTVTVSGATGDPLYVRAYQECASGDSFQWIGTPDDEARWPAVYLQVADELGNEAPPTHDMDDMDTGETEHDEATDDMATVDATAADEDPGDTTTVDGADDTAIDGDADAAGDEAATTDSEDAEDGRGPTGIAIATLVVVAVVVLGALAVRSRRSPTG